MALAIAVGAVISISAVLLDGMAKLVVFYLGIVVDALWQIYLRDKLNERPIHREHLVERIGLLAIIILGESMIAMVGSLSDVNWDVMDIVSATTGFFLIGAIWWIYFDSFTTLERRETVGDR